MDRFRDLGFLLPANKFPPHPSKGHVHIQSVLRTSGGESLGDPVSQAAVDGAIVSTVAKKLLRASQINSDKNLRRLAEHRVAWRLPPDLHSLRWHYCNYLMMSELYALKDKRIKRIFDKYTCVLLSQSVGLLFPKTLKEKHLPKHLRLPKKSSK